jgi:hypothetical protein
LQKIEKHASDVPHDDVDDRLRQSELQVHLDEDHSLQRDRETERSGERERRTETESQGEVRRET